MRVCKAIFALFVLITIVIAGPASSLTRRLDDSAFVAADGFDHDACCAAPTVELARVFRTVSFVDATQLPSTPPLHATPVLTTAPKTSPPLAAS